MSTYKFSISKRHIVAATDSSLFAETIAETHANAEQEALAQRDIDVAVYLDDVLKHTVTLTDAGATLQFDADVFQGDHTIKICAPKDPIQQTDICVDPFWIDANQCVTSQYNFNQSVLGTESTLRQMLCMNNSHPHNYVWWGHVVHNDSSLNLPGPFYRAGIVSDHQAEWHFDFTKTAEGKIWINNPGDVNDIMFDSTLQHTYYFVTSDDHDAVNTAYQNYLNQLIINNVYLNQLAVEAGGDSSTINWEGWPPRASEEFSWEGPGTYTVDSTSLAYQSDVLDFSTEDANNIVVFTKSEYDELIKGLWYHRNYTVTPITVT